MIFGKVGRLGHGKTMRAVVDAIALATERGAVLAANIRVRAPAGVRFEQLPMDGFAVALSALIDQVRSCSSCAGVDEWGDVEHGGEGCERLGLVLLVDEMPMVWDAHGWAEMSKADRMLLTESRKVGVDVFWTAQFVDQVEKGIRNVTEEVELLRAFPAPSLSRRQAGKRPLLLRSMRYRPGSLRELTAAPDKDKRLGSGWHRYRRAHEDLYRTDELVRPATRFEANPRCKQDCCRSAREACLAPCCTSRGSLPEVKETVPAVLTGRHPNGAQARVRSDRAGGAVDGAAGSGPFSPGERTARRPVTAEHGERPLQLLGIADRDHESSRSQAPGGRSPWEPSNGRADASTPV